MAAALVLETNVFGRGGSSPSLGTKITMTFSPRSLWLINIVMLWFLSVGAGMLAQQQYQKRGKTQFFITKDHFFQPVYPVKLTVEQDQGGVIDPGQALTCEVVDHVYPVQQGDANYSVHRTELKCGNNHFIVKNITF